MRNTITTIIIYIKKYGFWTAIKRIIKSIFRRVFNKKSFYAEQEERYQIWIKNNEPSIEELQKQKQTKFEIEPKISIIVPLYNTPVKFFKELVDCIINQTYENWELCLTDGSINKNDELEKIANSDSRIKYKFLNNGPVGISENTNEALKMATGDFIALLDHDDLLPIFCLYEIVKAINEHPDTEFIYTDEDKISEDGTKRCDPHFKPDFAIDTLRSNNYITHLSVFKKELISKIGGFNSKYNGAQDYDLILRMSENTDKILHIPKILYHWRINQNSTAMGAEAKPYAYESGIKAIEDHLKRQKLKAEVIDNCDIKGIYEIQYDVKDNPSVSIIIPNKDNVRLLKRCVNSILKLTTYQNYEILIVENNSEKKKTFKYYDELKKQDKIRIIKYPEKGFNYSKIINWGVKNCKSDFIMQLNNDTKLITPDWLEKFIGFGQRQDVGAVGARLYYKDYSIQHAGIQTGILGLASNMYVNTKRNEHAYFGGECKIRNVSAVTGACLFSKRKIYEEVGYMDEENFKVAYNDVDFCLKIRKKGYLIVYNPNIELIHYESKSRGYELNTEKEQRFKKECNNFKTKWKEILCSPDIYSNINFSTEYSDSRIRTDKIVI